MRSASFTHSIIYQDQNFLAINKWPGISTLSDRQGALCLLDRARHYHADAQVCHRLDKGTSGVLLFAKNQQAYRFLSMQFQNRTVEKVYHAIVEGRHEFRDKSIELPIHAGRRGHVRVSHSLGKEAITRINTVERYKAHTLVQCQPLTGRTHQIRVHLAETGAPIVGDLDYGGKPLFLSSIKKHYNLRKDTVERALMDRLALHAHSIKFQVSPENWELVEAEYPKDFRATLNQLNKHNTLSHS